MFIDRWIRTLIRLFVALAVIAIVAAFFISESRMTVLQAIVDQTCKSENPAKCIIMAKKLSQLRQTELAVSAWTFACERKDAESCWSVGLHHRANNRSDEGHVFLMRACEMNRPDYCRQQATMYFEEQNDKQALYSLSSACHMDDEESCHEYGRVATLLGDTSSEFRAYHRLCYTHSNDKSCGRLSYLLWMGKNPNAARKAVLHPCGGRIERACLLLASFHMQPIETPEIMNTRRLNMLGHLLDDYFHAADAVRRGGDFSGMHPDTALGIYTHRITPALQKVHQGLVADEPDRIPASPGRPAHLRPQPTAPSEVHRRYTRVVNLAYQALQQDILYLQTGRSTHRKAAQRAYSDARTEHQRAQSELRAAYALPPTGF